MRRLLRIDCSITRGDSISRRLVDYFVQHWYAAHPDTESETLDLVSDPLPHYHFDNLAGMVTPPEVQTDEVRAANGLADQLIGQLERAEILLIGCPMYNFTIPTQLKTWLDYVTRAGRTFKYTGPSNSEGLLVGKKAFIIVARGGEYGEAQGGLGDFQEPLLRHWLGFLGLRDVVFVRAEGLKIDPAKVPLIVTRGEEDIRKLIG
jgi:FMN-dependent NADH-azoreductase